VEVITQVAVELAQQPTDNHREVLEKKAAEEATAKHQLLVVVLPTAAEPAALATTRAMAEAMVEQAAEPELLLKTDRPVLVVDQQETPAAMAMWVTEPTEQMAEPTQVAAEVQVLTLQAPAAMADLVS
jgi:hypothetical protein